MKKFSISDIENLTGIKAHTIRIWEQRYNFFTSKRTETNIRYYDDDDLCLFLNIATLNENGYKISKISKMSLTEINTLVGQLKENHYNSNIQVQMLSNAMLKMDDVEFDDILNGCINEIGMEEAMANIIFPFLRKVGFMWQVGTINPAHEHFATHKIEQRIIVATTQLTIKNTKQSKKYLLFLPPLEHHEVGLLFAQYLLKSHGHTVLYLGQNLPFDSLSKVVDYYEPDFAVCILTILSSELNLTETIDKLQESLSGTPLILSGSLLNNKEIPKTDKLTHVRDITEFINLIQKPNLLKAS